MRLFKQLIRKILDIFNLPRFSQVPDVKIPKCKIPEIVPTNELKKKYGKIFKRYKF